MQSRLRNACAIRNPQSIARLPMGKADGVCYHPSRFGEPMLAMQCLPNARKSHAALCCLFALLKLAHCELLSFWRLCNFLLPRVTVTFTSCTANCWLGLYLPDSCRGGWPRTANSRPLGLGKPGTANSRPLGLGKPGTANSRPHWTGQTGN
jgi:hypothetical protein